MSSVLAARNDQLDLADYYDVDVGKALGDRLIQQSESGFERLSQFPESGTTIGYKHSSLERIRFIPVPEFGKILNFYKPLPDHIEIVRILHGARDIEEALH